MRVRTGRNLAKYPLPGAMIKEDRINFETIKDNGYLKKGLKLNKLDILFKKIEKND